MGKYYLAIDIGASSGRHILGSVEEGKLLLEEVFRFDNKQKSIDGHDCWDMENLWNGIIGGLQACKEKGKIPASIGIDTWGVDYALLDGEGKLLGDAVAYRDHRTDGMDAEVEKLITPEELYSRTGIQKQIFNTIYQLVSLKKEHPDQLDKAENLLMIPDYFNYLLTGVKKQEYTNATTTNLVQAEKGEWDLELVRKLELPEKLFGELSMPGTVVGGLKPEIAQKVGFDAQVILPATHDTGSAYLAVPAKDENAVYLSSGTWSLLGVENEKAITNEESRKQNFTNEGGAWHRFRYLKNIMGLWMIQSIRRELNGEAYVEGRTSKYADGKKWGFPDLIEAARGAEDFPSIVNVDDQRFLSPESMIDAIKDACRETGQQVPESVGAIMQCVYASLSKCYAEAIGTLSGLTGKKYTSINIVGGGCQDMYLNEMTSKATGLPVFAGPVEGTAIGNLLVQMISGGEFKNLQEARASIKRSFDIKEISA
ncbi:MAG: rhamnulokinase [Lachnospiraceae bacterium]|nr:rhamnulokinase [Lachnospiraceae bacterium]